MNSAKILEINLTSKTTSDLVVMEADLKKYMGGSGLASKILWEEKIYDVDPLSPENILVFMNGLLTGTPSPSACKMSVCAKSPLTNIWGEATVGGFFGAELSRTGYMGISLRGQAQGPCYILIEDDSVKICGAEKLWGKDTFETTNILNAMHSNQHQVACIGPGGEKEVLIAGIIVGGHATRAAGRTGLGAVMGSKKVKAIVVRGTRSVEIDDKKALIEKNREAVGVLRSTTKAMSEYGTACGVVNMEAMGDFSVRNWSLGSWEEGAKKTSGQAINESVFLRHYGCFGCAIRCGKDVRVDIGPYKGSEGHGPEYETCNGFGGNLLNDDLNIICAANDICNRLGIDTISTSNVIGWAMECYEHGIFTKKNTGDIDLTWGNGDAILALTESIGRRKDFGAFLGQGVRRCSEAIGGLALEFAVHTKGLEYPYHDPRAYTSMALTYATSNRGACHLDSLMYGVETNGMPADIFFGYTKPMTYDGWENKAEISILFQNLMELTNNLGICKFALRGKEKTSPGELALWVKYVTGWDVTSEEILLAGERTFNIKRLFNCKCGITRKDDNLPPRLGIHDKKTGRNAGVIPYLSKMLVEYYNRRGWTSEGIPTDTTIKKLSLE